MKRRPTKLGPTVSVDLEVRYAETDKMGVVHHSRYLVWFEVARTHLCLRSGLHYAEIESLGYNLVVTGAELRYRRGATYGDTVRVACWSSRLASRGVRFEYRVSRTGDGEELAEELATGATEHIWVEAESGKPCRLPDELAAKFRQVAEED